MDIHIVVGWDEMDAYNVLNALRVIPAAHPTAGDDFDPMEFIVSDAGIKYIQSELDLINQRFGCHLEWRIYPGDNFILVWRDELQKTIGEPNDAPIQRYYIDHHHKEPAWNNLGQMFEVPCSPVVICLIDAEVYYHNHLYDAEHSPYNSDQDSIQESNEDSVS